MWTPIWRPSCVDVMLSSPVFIYTKMCSEQSAAHYGERGMFGIVCHDIYIQQLDTRYIARYRGPDSRTR